MKNDESVIKTVVLARYGGIIDAGGQIDNGKYNHIQIIDFTIEKTILCVIDKENNNAIDIETGTVWKMINRDKNNRIKDTLIPGELYPVRIKDWEFSKMGRLCQLSVKAQAKKVYRLYLENRAEKEQGKQMVKNKEN